MPRRPGIFKDRISPGKYTAKQKEYNQAIKEDVSSRRLQHSDGCREKEYDDSLKKPKTVSSQNASRRESADTASAQTLELEAQLRTLQEHKSIGYHQPAAAGAVETAIPLFGAGRGRQKARADC
jgi:phage protein D